MIVQADLRVGSNDLVVAVGLDMDSWIRFLRVFPRHLQHFDNPIERQVRSGTERR